MKKILYVILAALAFAALAAISLWSSLRGTTYLIAAASLTGAFLLYFGFLFLYNTKHGWSTDGPLLSRIKSDEPLYILLQEHKRGYHVCVFRADPTPSDEELLTLFGYGGSVPHPFLLIGEGVLRANDFAKVENQTFLVTKSLKKTLKREPRLGNFTKRNAFFCEDGKRERAEAEA